MKIRAWPQLCLLPLAPLLIAAGGGLTPQEQRGRHIYLECTSPAGGEMMAILGEGVEVEASALTCASCHGRDGKGRPEGGVTPTDITWANLSKPYGVVHPTGRRHPPYDAKLMKRSLAMGFDPAGNVLHVAMPRYRMGLQDMEDLVAYLQKLGTESSPGVSGTELRIGFLAPPRGPLESMGRAVRSALVARFAVTNAEGGIYGRRLELIPLEVPPGDRRAGLAGALERAEVFTVVGALLSGEDDGLAGVFQERQVPLVGPLALHPREELPLNRYVFYLQPGIDSQARALARFARGEELALASPRPAVVAPREEDFDAAVEAVNEACQGWAPLARVRYLRGSFAPVQLAAQLAAQQADPIFFLGSGSEAAALVRAAGDAGWQPQILVTAVAADASLFSLRAGFGGRIWVGLPAAADLDSRTVARYRALAAAQPLPADHLSAQLAALAAAEVQIEGLKRAGRDLDRERFVESLEGLNLFATGYAPPISFGAGRRLGARGAYVYAFELASRRLAAHGSWITAE